MFPRNPRRLSRNCGSPGKSAHLLHRNTRRDTDMNCQIEFLRLKDRNLNINLHPIHCKYHLKFYNAKKLNYIKPWVMAAQFMAVAIVNKSSLANASTTHAVFSFFWSITRLARSSSAINASFTLKAINETNKIKLPSIVAFKAI